MTYKHLLYLLLLVTLPLAAYGQPVGQQNSAKTEIRQPSKQKIDSYAKDDAFNYEDTPQESQSLAEKIRNWLQKQVSALLDNAIAKNVLEIALYLGFAALIILLINQYLKGNMNAIFKDKKISKPAAFKLEQKEGQSSDLDKLIQKAIDEKQYNLATRYLYQKNLYRLQNEGYIKWKKNKTNRDYLYEIKHKELRKIFREVTRYYELAEYGNFPISDTDFRQIYARFKKLKTLIQPSA